MDVSSAKALLQRQEGGSSVYDHLTEVILRVITQQPANALEAFEKISASVKAGVHPSAPVGARVGGGAAADDHSKAVASRLAADSKLFTPAVNAEGAAGEDVQDLLDEATYLEWAGVTLGRTDVFRLHLSMKHLAAKYAVKKGLRFWGKLLGRQADYVVLEGQMDAEDAEEDAKDALGNTIEKTGEGANKYVYFVCNAIGDEWEKLPNVTPHQIIVARKIRRVLTGKLDAAVGGHPPFPGKEREYLRAQIALISAATIVAPSGSHTAEGDEGEIAEATEEWEAPDLTTADGWVHTRLDLNTQGRTKPNPPRTDDEGNAIDELDAPAPSTPLKPIGDDEAVEEGAEGGGAWDVRGVPVVGAAEGAAAPVAIARSLRWPGAYAVGFGKFKRWANVYVGYGHEVALKPYQPQLPAALPVEFDFHATEGQVVKEQPDVADDPDAGKEAADGGDGDDGAS